MLDIIIPAFNEEDNIENCITVISDVLRSEVDYLILFIDDGSSDKTWKKICDSSSVNSRVKGVKFSRNFGKEAAIFAGLEASKGDCAVVMDCDLQHPPEKIMEMYRLWEDGYEVVEGIKSNRGKEEYGYGIASTMFYKIIGKVTGEKMGGHRTSNYLTGRSLSH